MLNVFFDNIIFAIQNIGGISVYWYELTKRLSNYDIEVHNINHQKQTSSLVFGDIHKRGEMLDYKIPIPVKRFLPYFKKLPAHSIFHSSYERFAISKGVININTIHDLGYEIGNMRKGWKRTIHVFFKKIAIKKSHGIICISENTKADFLKFYPYFDPARVKVIYNGVSETYRKLTSSHNGTLKKGLPPKYILFVGARDEYKHFKLCVESIKLLQGYSLVIAGGKELTQNELSYLEDTIPDRYIFFNRITTEDLCVLYNHAVALLYPSEYEGFGIPIVEAMKCGCPVICCKLSSIPEVAGEAAMFIDLAQGVDGVLYAIKSLENNHYREKLMKAGLHQAQKFSWDICARETLDFYKEISKLN